MRGNQKAALFIGCVEDKKSKKTQAAVSQNVAVKRTNGKWRNWRANKKNKKNQGKLS